MTTWHVTQWNLEHEVHGTFYVGFFVCSGTYSVSRVYGDGPDYGVESFGDESYPSLALAQAAVARRIDELDGTAAAVCTVASEQLESCRPLEVSP